MIISRKLFLYCTLLNLLLLACTGSDKNSDETKHEDHNEAHKDEHHEDIIELTEAQYQMAGIQLGKVEQKNLSSVIKVNGVLDVPPQNLISISAPLGGFVKKTDLLQGMKIKKGQTIAVIENADFITLQQDYLETKNRLEYMKAEYERQKELSEENVSSTKVFQQTTAEFKSTKGKLAALEEKLSLAGINYKSVEDGKITRISYITSPINGYVTTVNVNIGKYVGPRDVMFELIDTEHLHVELTVFEKDVPKIKEGQTIRYTLADNPSTERIASVYLIGKSIGEDRTVRIHAHMHKEDKNLIPGMYVKALIETGSNTVSALPEEAIVQSGGKAHIFILKEKRKEQNKEVFEFQMKEIKRGVIENGFVEVELNSEEDIVIKGAYALLSKMKNSEDEEGGHVH